MNGSLLLADNAAAKQVGQSRMYIISQESHHEAQFDNCRTPVTRR
jgi:hypothetical protein